MNDVCWNRGWDEREGAGVDRGAGVLRVSVLSSCRPAAQARWKQGEESWLRSVCTGKTCVFLTILKQYFFTWRALERNQGRKEECQGSCAISATIKTFREEGAFWWGQFCGSHPSKTFGLGKHGLKSRNYERKQGAMALPFTSGTSVGKFLNPSVPQFPYLLM